MTIIKPSANELKYGYTLEEIFKSVADAAKVCYKTEQTRLSDKEFVQMLINKGHLRPLEFATVYLSVNPFLVSDDGERFGWDDIKKNHWTKWAYDAPFAQDCITTNLRVIYELEYQWMCPYQPRDILSEDYWLWKYLCEPNDHHYLRHTFEFICSRGCGDDFRTHVGLSSVMQSTRYCNYSKDKFGSEVMFIEPYWDYTAEDIEDFKAIEDIYMKKIAKGYQPQQAKNFLGLGIATILRMCGFDEDWSNFIGRRSDMAAYPECRLLSDAVNELHMFVPIEPHEIPQ